MVGLNAVGRPSGGCDGGFWSWECLAPKNSLIQRIISDVVTGMVGLNAVRRPNEGVDIFPVASY